MSVRPVSEFEQAVYEAVCRVPRGSVSTYGRVAAHLGCKSARAVGQALKRNPFAPRVPCHRVIAGDLSIGGFRGRRAGDEVRRKAAMLEREGVVFSDAKRVDPRCLYEFDGADAGRERRRGGRSA